MSPPAVLHINLSRQKLTLESAGTILFSCPVSSGKAGTGSQQGSGKTPLGRFRICKKSERDCLRTPSSSLGSRLAATRPPSRRE